jgi:hypothetical protein
MYPAVFKHKTYTRWVRLVLENCRVHLVFEYCWVHLLFE